MDWGSVINWEELQLGVQRREVDALFRLFDAVREITLFGGGDGDGWIVSEHYRELADWFFRYENTRDKPWFTRREDSDGQVVFWNGQESVAFVSSADKLPEWAGDIVVETHFVPRMRIEDWGGA